MKTTISTPSKKNKNLTLTFYEWLKRQQTDNINSDIAGFASDVMCDSKFPDWENSFDGIAEYLLKIEVCDESLQTFGKAYI